MSELLRMCAMNAAKRGEVLVATTTTRTATPKTKAERAADIPPGTRAMRRFIIQEKPGKKVVKEHLSALIARECESSSEEED